MISGVVDKVESPFGSAPAGGGGVVRSSSDAQSTTTTPPPQHITALGAHVRSCFEKAKRARVEVEARLLDDIRQRNSRYSDAKLAAIREVMGAGVDPPFVAITEAKCEAIYAWLIDALLPAGNQNPFSIEPTPEPRLPDFVMAEIRDSVMQGVIAQAEQLVMSGVEVNAATLQAAMAKAMDEAEEKIKDEVLARARESAAKMTTRVADQFAEGGWSEALRQSLHDFVDCGTAIMRGPVLREKPLRRRVLDEKTRKFTTVYETEVLPQWDRLVPLRFYPSPDATRTSMPWYVYLDAMSRRDLASLIGAEGYNEEAVRGALDAYRNGYREVTAIEQEKAQLEERLSTTDSELIDVLEFGGSVPGWMLKQWGVTQFGELDPQREYDAHVWLIGAYVIYALLNPDPAGLHNILSAGFSEHPDSFWGVGVPRKMRHSQNIANVAARNMMMNAAMASGPLTEMNADRIWPGENFAITPWKVIKSTNQMMSEGRAVNFYQPNMYSDKLINIFDFTLRLADIETGIPRILYAGESSVPTASATSMVMSNAAKGGQAVIRNIDAGLIIPAVNAQFNYIEQYDLNEDEEIFGDMRIVARGSSTMVAKEQMVMRLKEILRESANPIDQQVITPDIRAKLWQQAIEGLGLDPKLMGDDDEIEKRTEQMQMMQMQQQMMAAAAQGGAGGSPTAGTRREPPAPAQLDGAGRRVAGRDYQMYESPEGSEPG